MNLRQMEVFRHVMQTGSIKGAAELLHVSQPAVSKLLAAAERRSALQLFARVKNRLVPTPEAHQLYAEVERLWERVDRVRDLSQELSNPSGGTLVVGVSASLGATVVPTTVQALIRSAPQAVVRIEQLVPHLLVQSLLDGTTDIGVTMGVQPHPSLELLSRYPCGLVCVMPTGHPLSNRRAIRAVDLRGQQIISFPQSLSYGISPRDLYGAYAEEIRASVEVRSGQAACWYCLAGAGVAVVDATAIAGAAFPGLVSLPYRCGVQLEARLMHHGERPLSRLAQRFCELFDEAWPRLMGKARVR
ncbi:LysR family transcriptional regulator [Hydrogenophaga sp. BPS33]|uniref:LysR family transcriptional regulator n=1 Tax=Hydrogenophaga sp. BPS33 TaxID=2651974 RepID=UPI0013205602|nr:LysR substrate-binding domain-containing protein [Hydrogenophaga sp. BPS33]QHE86455.1 LysR family transcriptional regulator [Hydrogenophaga sp. BPS33]